jgi:hypothetical protein
MEAHVPGSDIPVPDPRDDADGRTGPRTPLEGLTLRELIVELSRTEDALREWRTRRVGRDVPVPDVHALLSRQRELVAELRRLSGSIDLTAADGTPTPAGPPENVAS